MFVPLPFAAPFFGTTSQYSGASVSVQMSKYRKRFSPTKFIIREKELPKIDPHIRERPKKTWSRYVYPSFLQLHEQISPHLFARELIHKSEEIERNGYCRMVKQRHDTKVLFPSPENIEALLNDTTGADNVFFDLYNLSTNVKESLFWRAAANLALSQSGRIPKPICHIRLFELTPNNDCAIFLVPKLIDELRMMRESHVIPMIGSADSKAQPPSIPFLQAHFLRNVPEFEDTRFPEDRNFKLEPIPRTRRIQTLPRHYTVSYILDESAIQSDIVSSFLFNSQFISVLTGSEGGGGDRDDDDDQASGAEIYQFFQMTTVVPDLQVKLENLKRSYALLVTRPFPEYNRFPRHLMFTMHLLFEKSARKVLAEMIDHYEHFAPVLSKKILAVINKINDDLPKFLLFLTGRCSFYASRSYFGFLDNKFDSAKRRLTRDDKPIKIKMTADVKWVYMFLKAYSSVVHGDLKPAHMFFDLIDTIEGELFVHRPFAGLMILIPTMVESFKVIDEHFLHDRHDVLVLRAIDRFLVKVAEKTVLVDGSEADEFLRSEAPLSMRMFLDYAVAMSTARKEISPQKLTFATYNGCKLMNMINTFSGVLRSFQVNGDFFALSDAYHEQKKHKMDYLGAVTEILQGREICGISKTRDNTWVIRKVKSDRAYQLSSHYIHIYEAIPAHDETSTEKEDTGDANDS